MNRRNFLSLAALAIAGKAAERVFPFRVYSIPKDIVLASHPFDTMFQIEASAQQRFMESLDGQKLKLYGGARGIHGISYYAPLSPIDYRFLGLARTSYPTAPQSSRP